MLEKFFMQAGMENFLIVKSRFISLLFKLI